VLIHKAQKLFHYSLHIRYISTKANSLTSQKTMILFTAIKTLKLKNSDFRV